MITSMSRNPGLMKLQTLIDKEKPIEKEIAYYKGEETE